MVVLSENRSEFTRKRSISGKMKVRRVKAESINSLSGVMLKQWRDSDREENRPKATKLSNQTCGQNKYFDHSRVWVPQNREQREILLKGRTEARQDRPLINFRRTPSTSFDPLHFLGQF